MGLKIADWVTGMERIHRFCYQVAECLLRQLRLAIDIRVQPRRLCHGRQLYDQLSHRQPEA